MAKIPTDMTIKARAMLSASEKLAGEYLAEGKPQEAAALYEAFGRMPVSMLARLHDVLRGEG